MAHKDTPFALNGLVEHMAGRSNEEVSRSAPDSVVGRGVRRLRQESLEGGSGVV